MYSVQKNKILAASFLFLVAVCLSSGQIDSEGQVIQGQYPVKDIIDNFKEIWRLGLPAFVF